VAEASIHQTKLNDVTHFGLRVAIGVIFIAHGSGKFNPGFSGFLTGTLGLPAEMQIPMALAEFVPGVLLIVGVLNRISASLIAIIMTGAIFYVKKASNLTGQGAYELDLVLLAGSIVIIAAGPGRISLAHVVKKLPRILH